MRRPLTVVPLPDEFFQSPIAHRGLHDCDGRFGFGRTENSFAAFRSAINHGYGIEVDIQLSADGVPIVFHDTCLKRLLKIEKKVSELTVKSLKNLSLINNEVIPTFDELLKLVSGQVPLLVEIKDQDGCLGKNNRGIEDAVAICLKKYIGPIAVMSYNPHSVQAFGKKLPTIPRGLVTEAFNECDWPKLTKSHLANLRSLKRVAELGASFISHEHSDLASENILRLPIKTKIFSWTIRNESDLEVALTKCDNITFEGFFPKRSIN